ncbi:MAG TPA: hypothetical protein VNN08_12110 [Thermoanaerobaculia bacterium]|nr:hypothetical protein [Thermoanaerobaculia bacterium]
MIDNMNPTSQFHPYQRETSIPVAERPPLGLRMRVKQVLGRVRTYLRANPATVFGGLAAIAISFGLLRARRS